MELFLLLAKGILALLIAACHTLSVFSDKAAKVAVPVGIVLHLLWLPVWLYAGDDMATAVLAYMASVTFLALLSAVRYVRDRKRANTGEGGETE